ncbi:MAG: T9SS type A sorting domain-containing protein [Bacteroidales bacterium]|nr:T9SS type A sorting domain-containing protein [Bacteroidales bacterium]
MFIRFESDSNIATDGFLASFESEIPVFCSGMMMLNEQTDTISDGSGNWNYHDNSACLWRIMPEGASSVTLYFNEFATEAGSDILKIYDLQTQQLLAEYSGTYESGVPDPVTSPSGKMFLSFNTNSMNTAPGWEAYYESNLVGLKEPVIIDELIVYPNPAKDYLNISFRNNSPAFILLNLADLSGRNVFYSELNLPGDDQIRIDIGNLAPGVYLLSSKTGEGNTEYHRVIKN